MERKHATFFHNCPLLTNKKKSEKTLVTQKAYNPSKHWNVYKIVEVYVNKWKITSPLPEFARFSTRLLAVGRTQGKKLGLTDEVIAATECYFSQSKTVEK